MVEWALISTFDSHSQFAISLDGNNCIDVNISGGGMVMTSFTDDGDYRAVRFESSEEFELFVKLEMAQIGHKGVE